MSDCKKMRIAFMGTPEFAVPSLKGLIDAGYNVVAVYTQPPRPGGRRGKQVQKTAVHQLTESYQIPVFTPDSLKSEAVRRDFIALQLDLAVVAAYGLILPKVILEAPQKGCINVHASLLPRWRGAAPIHRALLAGDAETGITIMKMDEGLDTGAIISKKAVPISDIMTSQKLLSRLAELGKDELLEVLPGYLQGQLTPQPQPKEGVTYASKLEKAEGLLDWHNDAAYLERKVRTLNPWPGVWFMYNNEVIKVLEASYSSTKHNGTPGKVINNKLSIACGRGVFSPHILQRLGRKPLPVDEFLRGYPLPQGTNLE